MKKNIVLYMARLNVLTWWIDVLQNWRPGQTVYISSNKSRFMSSHKTKSSKRNTVTRHSLILWLAYCFCS